MSEPVKSDTGNWAFAAFRGLGYFGQRYDVAQTREALLTCLAEAVWTAAGSMALALQVPQRGRWLLNLMRWLTPRRYARFIELEHTIWGEAIGFAAWKLRESLLTMHFDEARGVYDHAALEAGMICVHVGGSTHEERQRFIRPLNAALGFYDKKPTLEEALQRLSLAGGRHPAQSVSPELLREAQRGVVFILEPWAFIYRWERLSG